MVILDINILAIPATREIDLATDSIFALLPICRERMISECRIGR
jgi:hypothetical protein